MALFHSHKKEMESLGMTRIVIICDQQLIKTSFLETFRFETMESHRGQKLIHANEVDR